ncbi:hypothetical protein PRUPE_5G012500 [Prunus persica]|uniref:Uncharacterized protein n=1 Tax=Prunus persica TaxID=3760 RepID=A0A251P1Q2_PRUPE|nr:uncharacterized protein LOC18776979 isoform X2 [Prunus persica]ONI05548.1 hypothetical protein PRUPE_5G012500 [Prunus persica]
MRATSESAEWIFLATGLGLEILSAACDQASSPRTPHYALFGMLFAIAAVLISIWELIYRGKKERVVLRRWGMLWWFYHTPPPRHTPFGTLPDIYGLVAGISQCICSIVQYVYCLRHANSPFKASLLPAIFLMCLGGSKLCNNRMNANTTDNKDSCENSSSTEETSWHAIKADLPFLYDQETHTYLLFREDMMKSHMKAYVIKMMKSHMYHRMSIWSSLWEGHIGIEYNKEKLGIRHNDELGFETEYFCLGFNVYE